MGMDADVHERLVRLTDTVDKYADLGVEVNAAIMVLYSVQASFENFRCAIESEDEQETLSVKAIEQYYACAINSISVKI